MVDPGRVELPTFCVRSSCSGLLELRTHVGAPERIRTPISRFKRPDSGCLSYEGDARLVPPGGLEPPANRLEAGRSVR